MLINEVVEKKDVLLLMSNYNSYSGVMSGRDSFPNILDDLPCPVLIIPDDVELVGLTNYWYATGFYLEDFAALDRLSDLVEIVDGKKLTVFHSMEHDNFESQLEWAGFRQLVKEHVRGFDLNFGLTKSKEVRKELKSYIENEDPDMIVVLKGKNGFFKALFSESETHYVVTHFDNPVLIHHEQNMQ